MELFPNDWKHLLGTGTSEEKLKQKSILKVSIKTTKALGM